MSVHAPRASRFVTVAARGTRRGARPRPRRQIDFPPLRDARRAGRRRVSPSTGTRPAPTAPPRSPACARSASRSARRDRHALAIDGTRPRRPARARRRRSTRSIPARRCGCWPGSSRRHPFRTVIGGDASLRRRPMRRVIEPLTRMGARIDVDGRPSAADHRRRRPAAGSRTTRRCRARRSRAASCSPACRPPAAPRSSSRRRRGIIRSARWKRSASRVDRDGPAVEVAGRPAARIAHRCRCRATSPARHSGRRWPPARPGRAIEIEGVGLNPSRTAVLDVLRRAGAERDVVGRRPRRGRTGRDRARCRSASAPSFEIAPGEVPGVIDEIPALAALAAMMPAGRTFTVRGAARAARQGKRSHLGAGAQDFARWARRSTNSTTASRCTRGRSPAATVDAAGDHRLAMAFAIAGHARRGADDDRRRVRRSTSRIPGSSTSSRGSPR